MPPQHEFKHAAAECLRLAQTTTDGNARSGLLLLAQKFMDLCSGSPSNSDIVLAKLLEEFNDAQMLRQ